MGQPCNPKSAIQNPKSLAGARVVRLLILFMKDRTKMLAAIDRSVGDRGSAYAAAVARTDDLRAKAEDAEDDADDDQDDGEYERLIEHRRGDQLGERLVRKRRRQHVKRQDENQD